MIVGAASLITGEKLGLFEDSLSSPSHESYCYKELDEELRTTDAQRRKVRYLAG